MNPNSPKKERKFRYYLTVELPEDFSEEDAARAKTTLEDFWDLTYKTPPKISKVSYITSTNN